MLIENRLIAYTLLALLLYVGYETGSLTALAQAERRRRRHRAGPPYRVEHGDE